MVINMRLPLKKKKKRGRGGVHFGKGASAKKKRLICAKICSILLVEM